MYPLVKPKFFVPVHGSARMLFKSTRDDPLHGPHGQQNILIGENGRVMEFSPKRQAGGHGARRAGAGGRAGARRTCGRAWLLRTEAPGRGGHAGGGDDPLRGGRPWSPGRTSSAAALSMRRSLTS
jgi:hypothetical protein